jgi:hypothetical protein
VSEQCYRFATYGRKSLVASSVPNDVVKVADLVVELFTDTHRFAVLLIQQDPKLSNDSEDKVLANPPPELWIEDGRVFRVGEHHEAVVSELLSDQSLVSFANVKLVDVTLY